MTQKELRTFSLISKLLSSSKHPSPDPHKINCHLLAVVAILAKPGRGQLASYPVYKSFNVQPTHHATSPGTTFYNKSARWKIRRSGDD